MSDRLNVVLACLALVLAAAAPAAGVTKILIVPTARTIGANRYSIDLDRKEPLFDASLQRLNLTGKIGIGERVQLEAKAPLELQSDRAVLFSGKYTFILEDNKRTAAALGFENLGHGSQVAPYLALSRLYTPVDVTIGVSRGAESKMAYYTGIEYRPNERLHVLADYNTGGMAFAAGGFQYDFSRLWSVKGGLEFQHGEATDTLFKVIYNGTY